MKHRTVNKHGFLHPVVLVLVVIVLVILGVAYTVYTHATPQTTSTGTLIKTNCSPRAAASDGTMVWNSANTQGVFDAYIGDGNCNGHPLLPPYPGNRDAADITKDGRYVLLATAVGWDKQLNTSAPGRGSQNALQLYDRQTGKLSTLLPGALPTQRGIIWPKFNADDTKIVWGQMLKTPLEALPWGVWELRMADVNLAAGSISNIRSWQQPGTTAGLYEPYGWVPNTDKIIFDSTAGQTGSVTSSMQLFTIPDSLVGRATRISPPMQPHWPWQKAQNVYHEFAHFNPHGPTTLYTTIGSGGLGADLWAYDLRTASATGLLAQPQRITYFGGNFNAPLGRQAVLNYPKPAYRIVGSLAWVHGAWDASVCNDTNCKSIDAYRVTLPH